MKGKSLFVAVMFESRIYNMISHQHCLLAAIITSTSLLDFQYVFVLKMHPY